MVSVKDKKIINNQKEFRIILNYLIDNYYYNPLTIFSISSIQKNTNTQYTLVKEVYLTLKKEKLIEQQLFSNNFKLTYKGVRYLQDIRNLFENAKVNSVVTIITLLTFVLTVASTIYNKESNILLCILSFSYLIAFYYSFKKITNIK